MSEEQNIQGSTEKEIWIYYIGNQRTTVCSLITTVLDDPSAS